MSPLIAAMLTRLARMSFARTLVTAPLSLPDPRLPGPRPVYSRSGVQLVGFDLGLIPTDLLRETAVFGGLLLTFLTSGTGPVDWQVRAPWIRRLAGTAMCSTQSVSLQTFAH